MLEVRKVYDTDFFVGVLYNMNNSNNKTINKLVRDVNKLKKIVKNIPVYHNHSSGGRTRSSSKKIVPNFIRKK
jgi:hypothetical protein